MRLILFLIFIFSFSTGKAQIIFNKTSYDFGKIGIHDNRFVDIKLTNQSNKDAFILSVKKPKNIVYIKKSAFISPGQSTYIRFQVSQQNTGKFNYKIQVFTSDKSTPTVIQLKGEIEAVAPNNPNLTACPTFGQHPPVQEQMSFDLTVKTVDKSTGEELSKSKVSIGREGRWLGQGKTNNHGILVTHIPLGIYHFQATHSGYESAVKNQYINFKRNFVLLELTKKETTTPEDVIPQKDTLLAEQPKHEVQKTAPDRVIELPPKTTPPKEKTPVKEADTIVPPSPVATPPEEEHPTLASIDSANFNTKYFTPINVVFVIDISGSMRNFNRIEILKTALEELTKMLRPEDKIGVVSYANDASVLIRPTSGKKKDKIIKKVESIRPSGLTAGGKGIKLGYREVRKNEIKNGRNHLIIITDGAFNLGSDDYKQYIKDNLKKDITMSVVGVKCNERAKESMSETAQLGKGRLILLNSKKDAEKLKQEIRLVSFRFH